MKLYLAGPLFTLAERNFNVLLARTLEEYGFEVWLPQEHEPRELTAKTIFFEDVRGINQADVVVACMDGPDPDSGTCWEVGYAYAKDKIILAYRTDFRNSEDFAGSKYNLMLSQSATKEFSVSAMATSTRSLAETIARHCFVMCDVPIYGERFRHVDK